MNDVAADGMVTEKPPKWDFDRDEDGLIYRDGKAVADPCAMGDEIGALRELIADANRAELAGDLLAAAKYAQCSCSVAVRLSGHLVGCWMPDLRAAIAKAEGR